MIDFRYHLVSLVSVFLALAVGIVLGAGPLEGSIGDTLQAQVDSLRTDRDQLRGDLERSATAVQHREDYLTAAGPALLAGRLADRRVVEVILPGVEGSALDALDDALDAAGATVTGRVELAEAWVDPAKAQDRADLVDRLIAALPADGTTPPDTLNELLASALLDDDAPDDSPDDAALDDAALDEAALAILDGLDTADLVALDGDVTQSATLAVLIAPAVSEEAAATPPAGTDEALSGWAALAAGLDAAGDGTVVLGPASAAGAAGLVAAVREQESLAGDISTVDTGGSQMGAQTAVLALVEQVAGGVGAYGFEDGADAPLPESAADPVVPSVTPGPTTTATTIPTTIPTATS